MNFNEFNKVFNEHKKLCLGVVGIIVGVVVIVLFTNRLSPEVKFLTSDNMTVKIKATKSTFFLGDVTTNDTETLNKMTVKEAKEKYDEKNKTLAFDGATVKDVTLNDDKTTLTGNYEEDGTKVTLIITHDK